MRLADLLLLAIPVAFVAEFMHMPIVAFVAAAVAVLRLASWMGHATEQVALHAGPRLGGFLNGTFGNAAELVIAIMALRHGHLELVKASITGSILGNALLVLGAAILFGGLKFKEQTFNRNLARFNSSLMFIAVAGLVVPAIFHKSLPAVRDTDMNMLSLLAALVLLATYVASLIFSFRTHANLFHTQAAHTDKVEWSKGKAIGILAVATVFIVFMSEILVKTLESVMASSGLSEMFVGVIVVALVGNAAEHASAIGLALKSKDITTSIEIAVGSTTQIALLVTPIAVIASWFFGNPLSLEFVGAELVAILISVFTVNQLTRDGETNWLEGVMLLGTYVIIAIAFFFIPA